MTKLDGTKLLHSVCKYDMDIISVCTAINLQKGVTVIYFWVTIHTSPKDASADQV